MVKNKRGQLLGESSTVTKVLGGLALLVFIIIGIVSGIGISNGEPAGAAIVNSLTTVGDVFGVFVPIFDFLLDLNGKDQFIKIMSFILTFIVIMATLDSVSIFSDNKGGLVNFFVGAIVSIIGVRFMPPNMWQALTAPSSAFVATLLAGAPFIVMFFVTKKIRNSLITKGMWLFYLLTLGYIVINPAYPLEYSYIYIIFAILALIMLVGETAVRKWIFKQDLDVALQRTVGMEYTVRLAEIEARLTEIIPLEAKSRSPAIKTALNTEIDDLKKEYKKKAGKAYTK